MAILVTVFLVLLMLGMPLAFVMGFTGVLHSTFFSADSILFLGMIPVNIFDGLDSWVLMAIPLFLIAGEVVNTAGLAERLLNFTNFLVGRFKGGLAHVNVFSSLLFAGITGVAVADIAALGSVFVPAMEKEGYDRPFSAAVTAASSLQGPIIPPSIIIVFYAAAMELSVAGLFAAAIIPGLLFGLTDATIVHILAVKRDYPCCKIEATWDNFMSSSKDAFLAILFPAIIVGGILFGIFTPTEAASVAVMYALLLGLVVYRSLKFQDLIQVFRKAVRTSAKLFMLIAGISVLRYVFALERIPSLVEKVLTGAGSELYIIIPLLIAFLLFIGMWLTGSAAIILFAPIISPVVTGMGMHPFQWGIVMILALVLGLITPPVGLALFAVSEVAKVSIKDVLKSLWPFLLLDLGVIALVATVPAVTLFLPGLFGLL
jgi:tripartite ATP-independent transporter DctM subunit